MSDTRERLQRMDWSATPLGPMHQWPGSMRAVVDMALSSGFPVATAWGDDAIQIYNDAYVPIYGAKHPSAFGRPMRESWAEIWEFLRPAFEKVMATGEPLWFHDSLLPLSRHGRPEECWFDFSYSAVRDEQGRGIGMISIAVEKTREVVGRRRLECCDLPPGLMRDQGLAGLGEALRDRLAANPMDAAAAAFRVVDPASGTQGPPLWTIGDAAANDPGWRTIRLVDLRGQPLAQLELLPNPLVPRDSHASFVDLLADRLHRIVHHAEELGRAQAALAQQDQLYRFLFENIGEAAIYSATDGGRDSDEVILAANEAASVLLGYSREELVGMRREELFFPGNRALEDALAVREARRAFAGELEFRRRDGQAVLVEVNSRLVRTQDGEFRAVSLLRDVSARAAREAERAAQARSEAIAQLAGGMAHDFNNLLTVVLGSLEMLVDDLPPGSRASAYASNALLCAERGASLTNQLLSYSRRQPLKLQPVDLEAHLDELAPLVRSSLGEISQLAIQRGGPLPPCSCDLSQLTTALLNLASNARDAMPGGGLLALATDLVELPAPDGGWSLPAGRYVRLSVSDTGTGMAPELHERIFEPYFTTKGIGSGSGLGLAMVKGFVQQCGGAIRVHSVPGRGTRFELLFPVDERPQEVPARGAQPAQARGGSILVVEDNELVRAQVCGLLVGEGFEVRQAVNAREALDDVACAGLPSLVLTDLVMPGGLSGMQLAHELRQRYPTLPVVVMTGHDPWAAARDERDRQFEVLPKPFDRASLLAALSRNLG